MNAALAFEGHQSTATLARRPEWRAPAFLVGAVALAVSGAVFGPDLMGYVGVFGFSILTNAMLFLPSDRGAVMLAGAVALNPLAVAMLTGVGGALGEITSYALGRSTRHADAKVKVPSWLGRAVADHMTMGILVVSIVPSPFVDVIVVVASRMGYPLKQFIIYSSIGKVIQSIAFVYAFLWNFELLSSWMGLG